MATRSAYYEKQLNDGQAFQDFIAQRLYAEGIVLINFQSREAQSKHGENMLGLEIKLDKRFADTSQLWIEIAEKTEPTQPIWVAAGIDRDDNSWLYGIGNYDEFSCSQSARSVNT